MKPNDSVQKGGNSSAGQEANFTRQVSGIIEKYEKRVLPREPERTVFASDEYYEQAIEKYKRERDK